ncbi:MAG TPA: class I SAM-dependent methyltransferase [Kiritimatiellia bacterium]|nr:class I SAM-dependent methyltransferase [Kiritimatiellia bacterium]
MALPLLLGGHLPASILDVGCGTGTWLRSALDLGISDVFGLDGVALPPEQLHVPEDRIRIVNLLSDWEVTRTYELVISLEVAEHLPPEAAGEFVRKLTNCGDRVFFSAANEWQPGQNHLNCQWPVYWQELFNRCGFACRDTLRWKIWDDHRIEPWYRQNLFLAERDAEAGSEPRIPRVVHPDYMPSACEQWRLRRQGLLVALAERVDRLVRGRARGGAPKR